MTTLALIRIIVQREAPGEYYPYIAKKKGQKVTHYFTNSWKGTTMIFHKAQENGPEECMSQASMIFYFRGTDWELH